MTADYIGKTFGLLTVISDAVKTDKYAKVLVRCSCEKRIEKVVRLSNLKSGNTTSCGCEKIRLTKLTNTSHGLRKSPIYGIWKKMRQRCQCTTNKDFVNYGARGITVCKRWDSFQNFHDDMFATWTDGLTIERKNNNEGYSPENCKWSTRFEQSQNTRKNVYITYNGKTQCLSVWCRELGLKYHTVKMRIYAGRTPFEALTFKLNLEKGEQK
jgi:hypothetical protein